MNVVLEGREQLKFFLLEYLVNAALFIDMRKTDRSRKVRKSMMFREVKISSLRCPSGNVKKADGIARKGQSGKKILHNY